ncbi:CPBP family intramembrane metalloprotease [Actinoplanes sp. TRM 88003]|uniref:CPBP family intramembrane metalloprotease n=1 Tax=Paractinoplanes aksuensis TaxID=2939490 RepID=A0ABT1E2B7_9ACTN|nr:CPBP family intramembrane glutamic endopeptidase [Actinoplanes aksuensis]MCO8277269.1 CPBP family intramembrane metalloprotease [Actinoplanes aksuensis]
MQSTLVTPAGPVRSGISRWIAGHPLTAFLAWLFTVGQGIAFFPLLVDVPVPHQVFIVATSLLGLLLPAVAITWIADGPAAAGRFLRRFVDWRVAWRWYALALAVVPVVAVGLARPLLGAPTGSWTDALVSGFALSLVLTLIPNNWAEEGAWSGFFQARLQQRHSLVMAALLVAPVFALQHVSLAVGNPLPVAVAMLAFLAVLMVPYRILTGRIWNRTGSLLILGLVHAAGNAAGPGSGFGDGLLRTLYPGEAMTAGFLHLLAYAVVGLAVLALGRK